MRTVLASVILTRARALDYIKGTTMNDSHASQHKLHWYCLTPDRLVVAVLVVEVLLYASDRFALFGPPRYNPYRVLSRRKTETDEPRACIRPTNPFYWGQR